MQSFVDKIQEPSFPCIMAKAVMNQGVCHQHTFIDQNSGALAASSFNSVCDLVDAYRVNKEKLHSCILSFSHEKFSDFSTYEKAFWDLLSKMRSLDDAEHVYDPRVSNNPEDGNFSFSIKGEAFFILLLHPNSPRKARRFPVPSVVFNPHQQFEDLRAKGTFHKTRSLIRARDERYQGAVNPMLMDFGSEVSEVFQYTGLNYKAEAQCPFRKKEVVA